MTRLSIVHRAPMINIAILDTTTGLIVTSSSPKEAVFIIRYVCSVNPVVCRPHPCESKAILSPNHSIQSPQNQQN